MVKLSDRLQVLADQIGNKETMADIGTDHGFLPVYLWERGISPKVIFTDVSAGSLEKSRVNAKRLYPEEPFDFRLGNGLEKTKSFSKLILQPRSGQGVLRHWLLQNGFVIEKESLVREGKYICEVINAAPEGTRDRAPVSRKLEGCGPEDIEYEVPPWISMAGPLAKAFVENRIAVEMRILSGLQKSRTPDRKAIQSEKRRIAYLKSLLGGI